MASIRRSILRLLSLLAALTLLIPLETSWAENVGASITIGIQSTKTLTIHPFDPLERDMLSVYNVVYEGLVTIDDDYIPQGNIAQSWEETNNGRLWTFHLRTDVRFSDGTPLTAADVVASANCILERAQDENTTDQGFYANLKYFIKSITAKDDYTVTVSAKSTAKNPRAYYGLLYAMTFPIVPASQVYADSPAGSGPYVITQFIAGDFMTLEANPNWWKTQPYVRQIMVSFHETARSVIDSYEYNRVDAVFTRSIAAAQYKTGTLSVSMSYRTNQLECLYMNNSAFELTPEVRKAIRLVIDKQKIISNIYSGMAAETNFPFFPGTWMYNDSLDSTFTNNLDEARSLLAGAGWEDSDENGILDRLNSKGEFRNLSLRFYVYEEPDNDVRLETANMIAEQLAQVGISCKVEAMTQANVQEKLKAGSFDLALVSFAMDVCPDLGFMLMSGNTGNYCRYKSEKMTNLCKEARQQPTFEGYRQKLMEIQALFAEDCPFLCLYYRMGSVITRYMYTTCRDVREYELLRGIESFHP